MANYESPLLQGTVSTTYKGAGALVSSARRIMLYEIEFGQTGGLSSSDTQCQWDVSRFTNTNTLAGTSVAPQLLDPADVVAVTSFLNAISTEPPNITGAGAGLNLKNWGINQRVSYSWRALDDGDNLIISNTSLTGVEIRTLSLSFTGSAVGNISYVER